MGQRGDGRIYQRGNVYWICYYLRGEQIREAAKDKKGKNTNDPALAEKFLRSRLKQVHADECGGPAFITPKASRLTVGDLLDALQAKFEADDQASSQNLSHLSRARNDFGDRLAVRLKSNDIDAYKKERKALGHKPASINRTLQMLRQAFRLAIKQGHLSRAPYIELFSEKGNARKGFFTETEFRAVVAHLPADLQDLVRFAGATGMRSNELRSLTWTMIDKDGELQIPGDIAKNEEDRTLPLDGELAEIIERRRAAPRIEHNGTVRMAEYIFHRGDGRKIGEFRKSWHHACVAAGVGAMVCPRCESQGAAFTCPACKRVTRYHGRIFHDLRRFAVRNLVRAGCSPQVAKKWSGHVSDEIFERYNILTTDDLRQAHQQTQQYREAAAARQQKLVAMR
jgi:integrase